MKTARQVNRLSLCRHSRSKASTSPASATRFDHVLTDRDFAHEPLLDDANSFDLAFCREAFVEAFVAEFILQACPPGDQLLENLRRRIRLPVFDRSFQFRQVAKHPD